MAEKAELDTKGLGMALGTLCALSTMILGLSAMTIGWGVELVNVLSSLYVGYTATPTGIITGAIWGLIDGMVMGFLTAWLYNHFKGRL